jgi:ABC-type transport system involved in multi-copper enzyme maturation permease subunit
MPVRDLIVAELMKTRTRWLPYVLFVVMVLGAGVQVWLFGYTAWWDLRNETDPELASDLPLAIRTFTLPWGLPALVDSGQFWGSLIIGIFIASAVATEYNWGTVRQAVARGQSRGQWLTVKLVSLALFCAALLLIVLAWGVVSMMWTSSLAGFDITLDPDGPSKITLLDCLLIVLRGAMGILPYALLAFAITVIGRSTALGAAGIILFMIIESTLIPLFGALPDPWPALRSVTIGYNVSALLKANRIDDGEYASIAPREALDPSEGPDAWAAFSVLCLWCAGLVGFSYYVFRSRDLRLGTGE